MYGEDRIEVYSAGSRPSGQANPRAIETMRELAYDLTQHKSKSLLEVPNLEYDLVITMGCSDECPFVRAKRREEWEIPNPKTMPLEEFRAVRDLVESKVKALIATL